MPPIAAAEFISSLFYELYCIYLRRFAMPLIFSFISLAAAALFISR